MRRLVFVLEQFVRFYAQSVCNGKNCVQRYGTVGVFDAAQMIAADIRSLAQF